MLRDKSQEQAEPSLSPSFLRRFTGPKAAELHLRVRPEPLELTSILGQTESVYRQLKEALSLEGGSLEHVVRETVFFRSISLDLDDFLRARARVLQEIGCPNCYSPASIYVEQPPLDGIRTEDATFVGGLCEGTPAVEILVLAILPHPHSSTVTWNARGKPACDCSSCANLGARLLILGGQKHLFAGNVHGAPGSPYEEALSMFEVAHRLLEQEGMDFRAVTRTWIYLRDMDRDYGEFNRARRTFFRRMGITLLPASTGINGSPFAPQHNFVLGLQAIQGSHPIVREMMTTPTLNEAPEYGSDFSRGLRVVDSNKITLYVSGTASVDERGRTVHGENFEAQVERMLLNVEVLLERQGATFRDMVSAVTYIKRGYDAPAFRRILEARGINGFPNVVVEAGVCRPDLLCEMEGIAVLPRGQAALSRGQAALSRGQAGLHS